MSQEETMRLVAQVVDKFSKPLGDMQKQLRGIKPGQGSKQVTHQFGDMRKSVDHLARDLKSNLRPALTGINFEALSVGGAIAAVGAGLSQLGSNVYRLNLVSKDTGIAIDRMRAFQAAGEDVGVTGDRIGASMETFARNMKELRHGMGGTLSTLFKEGDVNVRNFAKSLEKIRNNEEALKRIFHFLERITNPIDKQRFLEAFGLPAEFSRMTSKQLDEYARRVGHASQSLVNDAKRLHDEWHNVRIEWDKFLLSLGNLGAFKAVGAAIDGLKSEVDTIGNVIRDTAKAWDYFQQGKYGAAFRQEFGWHNQKADPLVDRSPITMEDMRRRLGLPPSQGGGLGTGGGGGGGWGDSPAKQTEKGTRKGVLQGMREWWHSLFHQQSFGGQGFGGGRVIQTAYEPGGGMRHAMRRHAEPIGGGGHDAGGTGSLKGNRASWMEFAMRDRKHGGLGLNRAQAAGLVGNLQGESGRRLNPHAVGDHGTSYGTAQWHHGRWSRLRHVFPDTWRTMAAQQRYMRWEMDHTEHRAYAALRHAQSPEQAARIANRLYERSRDYSARRERNARRLYDATKAAGLGAGATAKINGSAKVSIDLQGFPQTAKVRHSVDGDLFGSVSLRRGRAMPLASEGD